MYAVSISLWVLHLEKIPDESASDQPGNSYQNFLPIESIEAYWNFFSSTIHVAKKNRANRTRPTMAEGTGVVSFAQSREIMFVVAKFGFIWRLHVNTLLH